MNSMSFTGSNSGSAGKTALISLLEHRTASAWLNRLHALMDAANRLALILFQTSLYIGSN